MSTGVSSWTLARQLADAGRVLLQQLHDRLEEFRLAALPSSRKWIGRVLDDGRQHAGAVGRAGERVSQRGKGDLHAGSGENSPYLRRVEGALDVVGRRRDDQPAATAGVRATPEKPGSAVERQMQLRSVAMIHANVLHVADKAGVEVTGAYHDPGRWCDGSAAETIMAARISSPVSSATPAVAPFLTRMLSRERRAGCASITPAFAAEAADSGR